MVVELKHGTIKKLFPELNTHILSHENISTSSVDWADGDTYNLDGIESEFFANWLKNCLEEEGYTVEIKNLQ